MIRYSSIHRQQLFHWIGSHLDEQSDRGRLTDGLREQYVACLETALDKGLWVKTPRDPDFLGQGDLIKVQRPICCFTEWTLGHSLPHTTRYGRLGLGFPKKFVLARGGQPVTYVRDSSRQDPYTAALLALARAFTDADLEQALGRRLESLRKHFDYLTHFNKKIKKGVKRAAIPRPVGKAVAAAKPGAKKEPDVCARSFGGTLHYLEEREWRIVYDESLAKFFQENKETRGPPPYYLPFEAGRELFTVVLPDNRTVNVAMQQKRIREHLFRKEAPHVTLLSLQDIGTF